MGIDFSLIVLIHFLAPQGKHYQRLLAFERVLVFPDRIGTEAFRST
jgi:hypothetical protein